MPYSDVIGMLREARERIDRAVQMLGSEPIGENPVMPDNPGVPAVYGKDGYSDANDPRHPNCREYKVVDGKVIGVNLLVHAGPLKHYRVSDVSMSDEVASEGQTLIRAAVYDKQGQLINADVRLAYPYDGQSTFFANYITAGNEKNEFVMVNKYWPPGLGPLALMILDEHNNIISDVVGSLGLPLGHHLSFFVSFQER